MRLCLAGLNSIRQENHDILKSVPFVLESIYYIKDFQIPLIKTAELFLLDSGAFTFMQNAKKNVDWDEYLDKYIAFINTHDVQYFFELDIDAIVGYERVKQLRKRLESETQKKCMPVWHKSRGVEEFKRLVEEYDYIGIGGFASKDISKEEYPRIMQLVKYAKQQGTKVHGLGYTKSDVTQYGFYSADSTTWNRSRFGDCCVFADGRMKYVQRRTKRLKIESLPQVEAFNITEWIKYQNYLRRF